MPTSSSQRTKSVISFQCNMISIFIFVAKICKLVCDFFFKMWKKVDFLGFSDCQDMKIKSHFQINILKKNHQVLHYLLGFIHNDCKNLVAKRISPLYSITSTRGYPNGFQWSVRWKYITTLQAGILFHEMPLHRVSGHGWKLCFVISHHAMGRPRHANLHGSLCLKIPSYKTYYT
jgi:hypothetical protein